jgi:hypothetical protein
MNAVTRFADHFSDILTLTDQGRGVGVSSNLYDSQIGRYQRISPTGAAVTVEPMRLVGGGFQGSLDTMAWTAANSGVASAVTVTNQALLNSGTASGGYASIQAVGVGRFLFASTNNFRGTYRMSATGVANAVAKLGAFSFGVIPAIQDGYFFSYDGTTLSCNTANGGVVTTVSSGSFNGDVAALVLDTNAHNFEIVYQVAAVYFFVDNVLLHKFRPTIAMLSSNMHLSTTSLVTNTGGSAGMSMEVWASSIIRFGSSVSALQSFHFSTNGTNVLKLGPGRLEAVVSNNAGTGGNSVTIYDNTSATGKIIAILNVFSGTNSYNLDFFIGLTIVSAGGSAPDMTIVFE